MNKIRIISKIINTKLSTSSDEMTRNEGKIKWSSSIERFIKCLVVHTLIISNLLLVSPQAYADINKLIRSITPKGTMSNASNSTVVKDQLAGHLIGGSVIIRTPATEEMQLMNLQAPKCNFGGLPCAAQFDLRAGAFSFVSKKAMAEYMKNLVKNAGPYAAMMAIKSICPQCEDIMTWLEAVARDINNHSILSCDNMMKMVNGSFSKLNIAGEANRQSHLVTSGGGLDMTEIADRAKKDNTDPVDSNNPVLKSQLGDNFNLVWKSLEKGTVPNSSGNEFKELLMSISGTIIIQKDESPKNLMSLVNKELIEQYIGNRSDNAEIELYECNESTKCLSPKIVKRKLNAKETLYGRIDTLLTSIIEKVKINKNPFSLLTEEEDNLISLSSIPLLKKIQQDLGMYADSANASVRMNEFIEALCYDVVTTHITRMLQQTTMAVNELSHNQLTDTGVFDKFNNQSSNVLQFISNAKFTAFKRYDIIAQTKARMRSDEKYFKSKFEAMMVGNLEK